MEKLGNHSSVAAEFLVDGKYGIKDLVNIDQLRGTLEDFSAATGFTTGFVSYPEQEILIATGWRDICTKFFRACPESAVHCKESNVYLTSCLKAEKELSIKPCNNGLVDAATPVIVRGKPLANLCTGQVLLAEANLDEFKKRAEKFGYDVDAFLEALSQVPVVSEKQLIGIMKFLSSIAVMIAEVALENLSNKENAQLLSHEIQGRKSIEDKLRESEERYRSLVDHAPDAILIADREGQLLEVNKKAEEMLGLSEAELCQMTIKDIHPGEELERTVKAFERIAQSGHGTLSNAYLLKKDGSKVPVDITSSVVRVGDKVLCQGVFRDISERKKAEHEIQKAYEELGLREERFKLAAQVSSDLIYEWNIEDDRLEWFGDIDSMLGYEQGEFPSTIEAWVAHIHPEDQLRLADAVEKHRESTECINEEYRIRCKDGAWLYWLDRGAPILNEAGRPVKWIGSCTDITFRKKVEKERENLISELADKNMELERFTYTVSHDLRSPLITIKGFTERGQSHIEQDELEGAQGDLTRVRQAVDRMERMLKELLELSRVGSKNIAMEKISLSPLVKEAVEVLAGRIGDRNIEINIAENLPAVRGNYSRLLEVFKNLIENAIKFTDRQEQARIEIGAVNGDPQGVLYVKDNGRGINPKYHKRVFGLFDKLDPNSEGTGIGLALVKRIIEIHNGRIWVESEGIDKGSRFCFMLNSENEVDLKESIHELSAR